MPRESFAMKVQPLLLLSVLIPVVLSGEYSKQIFF